MPLIPAKRLHIVLSPEGEPLIPFTDDWDQAMASAESLAAKLYSTGVVVATAHTFVGRQTSTFIHSIKEEKK